MDRAILVTEQQPFFLKCQKPKTSRGWTSWLSRPTEVTKPAGSWLVSSCWVNEMLKQTSFTLVERVPQHHLAHDPKILLRTVICTWSLSMKHQLQTHVGSWPQGWETLSSNFKDGNFIKRTRSNQYDRSQTGFVGWTGLAWKFASTFSKLSFIKCKPHPPGIPGTSNQALWSWRFLL